MKSIIFDDKYRVTSDHIYTVLREISSKNALSLGESLFFVFQGSKIRDLIKFSEHNLTKFGMMQFTKMAADHITEKGGIQFCETSKVYLSLYPVEVFKSPKAYIGLIIEKRKLSIDIKDFMFKEKFYAALQSIIKYNFEYIRSEIDKELQTQELSQKLSEEGHLSKTLEKKLTEKINQITHLKDKISIKDSMLKSTLEEMQDIFNEFNSLTDKYNEINRESIIAITNLENQVHNTKERYNQLQNTSMKQESHINLITGILNSLSANYALINKDFEIVYYSDRLLEFTRSNSLTGVHCYIAVGRRSKCPNCQLDNILSEKIDCISIDAFSSLLNNRIDITQRHFRIGPSWNDHIIDIYDFDIADKVSFDNK